MTGQELENVIVKVISKYPNGVGGLQLRREINNAAGDGIDYREIDNAIKRLKNARVIKRPNPSRLIWVVAKPHAASVTLTPEQKTWLTNMVNAFHTDDPNEIALRDIILAELQK
ncbi:MAG TPA: hypothetical protein VIG47_08335 [Gemmatimonadaceae bacterium]|jgi:hypothetical protein